MGLNLYKEYESDENVEVDGAWIDLGDGAKVKVARWGNPNHEKVIERLRRPYRSMIRSGRDLPKQVSDRIATESLAEAILLGWEGLLDRKGKAIPYSKENALNLLSDPALKDFRETISSIALQAETFRKESLETAAGNSKSTSDGESDGATKD